MPIAGVDEVGRGPLAGPVVAAAVILRAPVDGLADSKTLPAARREALAGELRAAGAVIALGAASVAEIDRLNILRASLLAMRRAVLRLALRPELILVDGSFLPPDLPCAARAIIGGDATEPAIAAASIVAKVARDRLMRRLASRHAGYAWERNAGYGTPAHLAGLARLGATRHHRQSFRPVRETGAVAAEGDVSRASGSSLHPLGTDGGEGVQSRDETVLRRRRAACASRNQTRPTGRCPQGILSGDFVDDLEKERQR